MLTGAWYFNYLFIHFLLFLLPGYIIILLLLFFTVTSTKDQSDSNMYCSLRPRNYWPIANNKVKQKKGQILGKIPRIQFIRTDVRGCRVSCRALVSWHLVFRSMVCVLAPDSVLFCQLGPTLNISIQIYHTCNCVVLPMAWKGVDTSE